MSSHTTNEPVKQVPTKLAFGDFLGAWKARWGIGRMDYTIKPGLYAVGKPDSESPVLVSANYKLTFDALRKNLGGLDCWIMILDTGGINVWCAAGKGAFGTDELVNRIEKSDISKYVSHKQLVLPQLGAAGVSAYEVARSSGFNVVYGPVRAKDIKEFIREGYKATEEMRMVNFTLWDRMVLVPMELVPALKKSLPFFIGMALSSTFLEKPFGKADYAGLAMAIASGSIITPVLLPAIPGKAFSLKGWIVGLGGTAALVGAFGGYRKGSRILSMGHLLLFPAVSSYLALNFTGSTTYTSHSGVNKEMRKALPLIVGSAFVGAALAIGAYLFRSDK
ncbi:MAG: mercury methylation corrinoid protein HgcA [Eubacteriaceae bacterium]|nr:mercury methylation corrinoid protein HgcA [Eubacteriaceae bacterium]